MGCSERWGDCLNKGSLEQTAIRDTGQAQLICILFAVTSCWAISGFRGGAAQSHTYIHTHAMNKHIMCKQTHVHIMDTLFIALSALVSCFCVGRSCLLMTGFMDYGKSSSTAGVLIVDCGCKWFPVFSSDFSSGSCFRIFILCNSSHRKSKGQQPNCPVIENTVLHIWDHHFVFFKTICYFFKYMHLSFITYFHIAIIICMHSYVCSGIWYTFV